MTPEILRICLFRVPCRQGANLFSFFALRDGEELDEEVTRNVRHILVGHIGELESRAVTLIARGHSLADVTSDDDDAS